MQCTNCAQYARLVEYFLTNLYVCKNFKAMELKTLIEEAWSNRELLQANKHSDAVRAVIEEVDKGRLRVASPEDGKWVVNEWVKQAILMYFGIQQMQTWTLPPFEFYDKMLLKSNYVAILVN